MIELAVAAVVILAILIALVLARAAQHRAVDRDHDMLLADLWGDAPVRRARAAS